MMRASSVAESTARAVVAAVGRLRREPLTKPPGVAEAVDWAEAATLLHQRGARWPDAFKRAIGVALKDEEDLAYVSGRLDADHRGGGRVSVLAACGAALRDLPGAAARERLCGRAGADRHVPRGRRAARPAIDRRHPPRRACDACARRPSGAPRSMRCSTRTSSARSRTAKAPGEPRTRRSASRKSGAAAPSRSSPTRSTRPGRTRRPPRRCLCAALGPRRRRGAAPLRPRGARASAAPSRLPAHARAPRRSASTRAAPCARRCATTAT